MGSINHSFYRFSTVKPTILNGWISNLCNSTSLTSFSSFLNHPGVSNLGGGKSKLGARNGVSYHPIMHRRDDSCSRSFTMKNQEERDVRTNLSYNHAEVELPKTWHRWSYTRTSTSKDVQTAYCWLSSSQLKPASLKFVKFEPSRFS